MRGVVVKLGGNFSYTKLISDNILSVGAATLDRKLANFAKDKIWEILSFIMYSWVDWWSYYNE